MSDLDDFFRKKDKKKDKFKGRKFGNPEEIAKQLEESEKKLEKDRLKAEPKVQLDGAADPVTEINPHKEEEEWKDFNEDKEDLRDLKISRLQIEDEEDGIGGGGSADDEGFGGPNDKGDGVWSKNIEKPVTEPTPEPIKEETESPATKSTPSSYVPPHLRNAQPSPLPRGGSRRPKQAPDITNEMSFPSLGSQPNTPANPWGRSKKVKDIREEKGFENVKHGSPRAYQENNTAPKLSTTNRFDALSDNS